MISSFPGPKSTSRNKIRISYFPPLDSRLKKHKVYKWKGPRSQTRKYRVKVEEKSKAKRKSPQSVEMALLLRDFAVVS